MFSELTTEKFNKIKQIVQGNEDEILKLHPYLSQDKIISQEEHDKEAVIVMERIKEQLPNVKFNEISAQENIQEKLRFVNLINEMYLLIQQEKKILQEEDQLLQELQHAEEQLQQAKKKLEPIQEKLKLINQQGILFNNMFIQNKEIVMRKLTAK